MRKRVSKKFRVRGDTDGAVVWFVILIVFIMVIGNNSRKKKNRVANQQPVHQEAVQEQYQEETQPSKSLASTFTCPHCQAEFPRTDSKGNAVAKVGKNPNTGKKCTRCPKCKSYFDFE